MQVTVTTSSEYIGRDVPEVESFDLTVNGEPTDSPEAVVETYLRLRKKLKEGIKEGTE